MRTDRPDYAIEAGSSPGAWILRGVLRLDSPEAYTKAFAPITASVGDARAISIDLSPVVFLNSSGIRGLADVLLAARAKGVQVTLYGSAGVPWQKKLAASLTGLFPEIAMRLNR
ncbi:MAG TPA: STAS domain-containing protein [Anaeromyxobacter sp.]